MAKTSPAYTVELRIGDTTYTENGNTIAEALGNLKPNPIKGKTLLKVISGSREAQILMYPLNVKRLVVNKTFRDLLDKRLNTALK